MSTTYFYNFPDVAQNASMTTFGQHLEKHLEQLGLSGYRFALDGGIDPALMHKIITGKRRASDEFIQKIAAIKQLSLNVETLRAWRLMDEYEPNVIEAAHKWGKQLSADSMTKRMDKVDNE